MPPGLLNFMIRLSRLPGQVRTYNSFLYIARSTPVSPSESSTRPITFCLYIEYSLIEPPLTHERQFAISRPDDPDQARRRMLCLVVCPWRHQEHALPVAKQVP